MPDYTPDDAHLADDDPVEATRMPLAEHLDELRSCLIRALLGVALCAIVSLVFAREILTFLITPVLVILNARGENPELLALNPISPFLLYLKTGFFTGLIVSFPWVLYQIWLFVSAGLYQRERRWVKRFLPIASALFACGVMFMFVIVLPIVLNFLISFNQGIDLPSLEGNFISRLIVGRDESQSKQVKPEKLPSVPVLSGDPLAPSTGAFWFNRHTRTLNIQTQTGRFVQRFSPADRPRAVASHFGLQYVVSLIFGLALGFGIAFETPIVVVALSAVGIVSVETMARSRRYVLFAMVIAAAILTPPDVISQILLALPMYVLFEAGLAVAKSMKRDR